MNLSELLVIDDEESILHAFRRILRGKEFHVTTTTSGAEGLRLIQKSPPDVVVCDVHLADASGLNLLDAIQKIDARIPVILITGHGTTELAIEAIKRGAFDYLLKPLELEAIRAVIDQAARMSRMMQTPAILPESEPITDFSDVLIGRSPTMQEVFKQIGRVAPQDVTVLIRGESGTGKELAARAIYHHGKRANKPFLALNCAAIPETLLESELFGHERGAFTGADRLRIGKFEQCDGGTLFLDEVGEMSPLTQAKFLRVLQEQTFERVGGNQTIRTNARIIAATNVDLEQQVAGGKFRKDLYFRLSVFVISLPPLRERGADLSLLIEHFLGRFSTQLQKPVHSITQEALHDLEAHSWPGNVRELQSVMQAALLQMRGSILTREDLPELRSDGATESATQEGHSELGEFIAERIEAGTTGLYAESLERMERELLIRVLTYTQGNQVQAAKLLGITRGSLRNKLKQWHIAVGRSVWSENDQAD